MQNIHPDARLPEAKRPRQEDQLSWDLNLSEDSGDEPREERARGEERAEGRQRRRDPSSDDFMTF